MAAIKNWLIIFCLFVCLTFASTLNNEQRSQLPHFLNELYKNEMQQTAEGRRNNLENMCNMHAAFVDLTKTMEKMIVKTHQSLDACIATRPIQIPVQKHSRHHRHNHNDPKRLSKLT